MIIVVLKYTLILKVFFCLCAFEQFRNNWFDFLKNYLFECNSKGVVEQIKALLCIIQFHSCCSCCCLVNGTKSETIRNYNYNKVSII